MQKHMAEMNAKLQSLVDDMNKAKGSAKVDNVASLINEPVMQRSMLQTPMMAMHPAMEEPMRNIYRSGL